MRQINLKKAIISSAMGAIVLVGTALIGTAQTNAREYRDWQKAQQDAQKRQQDYNRTHNNRDYERWQRAQQLAMQRQLAWQQYNSRYNNGYGYNNGNYANSGYRIYTNGSYYSTDRRGYELLRQAVNRGYSQGYAQGQAAKRRGWGYNYNREDMYRSGTYGYQSYVSRDQYQYYYQQGFQRGYEDGYNNTMRYGYRQGNAVNLVSGILNTIINLSQQ